MNNNYNVVVGRVNCRMEVEELKAYNAQLLLEITQYRKESEDFNKR